MEERREGSAQLEARREIRQRKREKKRNESPKIIDRNETEKDFEIK